MGFDTSFHPVDLRLIEHRLLPYVAGHGADDGIDDLLVRAVEIRKIRFRAKAWALGLHAFARKEGGRFDAHLYVWGRPFLIVGDGSTQIAQDLMRCVAARPDEVDGIAQEMITRLDPSLGSRIQPDGSGQLPGDVVLADSLATPMRILRGAALAVRAGQRTVPHPDDGRELDAARLLTREVPFTVLEMAASLLPGWMSRGRSWPTGLCADADIPAVGFGAPTALTGPLRQEFPDLPWPTMPDTIIGSYSVGGLVPASEVSTARGHLGRCRRELMCDALDVRKMDEAMGVAEHLGVGFCEAADLYSGIEGNLN